MCVCILCVCHCNNKKGYNGINTKLVHFIKFPHFSDIHFWRFEDESMYLHMDISEQNVDADYWKEKIKEKEKWR